jgi:hypothetical protein
MVHRITGRCTPIHRQHHAGNLSRALACQGEYMGSSLTSMVEALWPYMKHDPGELKFGASVFEAGVNKTVKDLEEAYPPEWRMSRSGRKRK